MSLYKHAIAIRVEPICLLYGIFIRCQGLLASGEGRDQHDEGRFRQVEVSQHGADQPKFESRVDKDVGFAALGDDAAIFALNAAYSRVRTLVVPMATMRRPASRAR